MPLSSTHRDFQVEATVVRRSDRVRKTCADRIVRPAQALGQQPARTDFSAYFLVVCEVQLDAAIERMSTARKFLQRAQCVRIGGEIGLAHRDSASIHGRSMRWVAYYLRSIGITCPAQTGRYHVAMCIERNTRSAVPEAMPDDEIGCRYHADCADSIDRHRMGFDGQSDAFQQRPNPLRMCRAIAGRIVCGNLDYFSEKVALGSEAGVDDLADL